MKKLLPVMTVALLLSGCALMGPSPENPELVEASRSAQDALQTAREVGAQETHSDDFSLVQQRYNELNRRKQSNPSMDLVDQFLGVERGAYETAVNSLQTQLDQKESRFQGLQTKVDDLRSKLENRVNSLEKRVQTLERQNNQLQQENNRLTSQTEELKQQKNELQTRNNELRSQISQLNKQKKALRQNLNRLRDDRSRLQAKLEDSSETIARLRKELEEQAGIVRSLKDENRSIKGELDQKLQNGDIRTKDRKLYISLKSKLLFGVGNVHVQEDIKSDLKKISDTLKKYPNRDIMVEGHTDDLPLQNELKERYGSNWELSAHRAINVLKYLVYAQGIEPERISAAAYGKFRPRVKNNSPENRRKNRRVEIVLLPPELSMTTKDLTE